MESDKRGILTSYRPSSRHGSEHVVLCRADRRLRPGIEAIAGRIGLWRTHAEECAVFLGPRALTRCGTT